MREKLNDNPLMQVVVIGVLLLATGIFVMSTMGRGGGEESEASESSAVSAESLTGTPSSLSEALAMVSQASTGNAPPLPRAVTAAWKDDKTVVLLIVHDGGIDDALVAAATARLALLPEAAVFIVPASKISRYAAITQGVGVNRVPALVVVRPKRLHQTIPTASVSYGFQSGESLVQAVIDAGYRGPTLSYHP